MDTVSVPVRRFCFLFTAAHRSAANRPDESRKTRDARGELVQVRLPPRLVELRSLLHTRGHPLVCAARAMYVIPDMDRYVLLNKSDCERLANRVCGEKGENGEKADVPSVRVSEHSSFQPFAERGEAPRWASSPTDADCPEPGEVKGQHALGNRQLRRLVPSMD